MIWDLIKFHQHISNYLRFAYVYLFIHCSVGPAGPTSWPRPQPTLMEQELAAAGDEAGAGVTTGALDAQGRSALVLAVGGGHLGAARALLRGGAPCCDRARQLARDARESEMLALLDTACAAQLGS